MTKGRMLHSNRVCWLLFDKSKLFFLLIHCMSALVLSTKVSGTASCNTPGYMQNTAPSFPLSYMMFQIPILHTRSWILGHLTSPHNPKVSCLSSQSAPFCFHKKSKLTKHRQSLQFCGSQHDCASPHTPPFTPRHTSFKIWLCCPFPSLCFWPHHHWTPLWALHLPGLSSDP